MRTTPGLGGSLEPNSSTTSTKATKIKEKFFPCTNSFLRSIRGILKPALRFFAIQIQTLYPFECKEGKPFKLDPKMLAQELGYRSERSPQRFIAALIKEGFLERVGRKVDQLYRWVKKKVKKLGQKETQSTDATDAIEIPAVFGFSSVATLSQEGVEESKAIAPIKAEESPKAAIAHQPQTSTHQQPKIDKYFGQWEERRSNLGPDSLVPDGPWKNSYGKLHPEFVDWAALRWIKDRPDQFPTGGNKTEMSRARANIKGYFSVKPKETERLTEMDYVKKTENLEKHWEEFKREFEDLKSNYRIRTGGVIREEELKRYTSMALILEPESVAVENLLPKTETPSLIEGVDWNEETMAKSTDVEQVIPAHCGQGDQGASNLDCSPKSSFKPKHNKFLASTKEMFEHRNKAKEEAISQRRQQLLAMGPGDPFLEHARTLAKLEGLEEVFNENRRLIGFAEPEELEF